MDKIKLYRRVLKVVFEPAEIDSADLLTQAQAAALSERTIQDVSTAIRTGRVNGLVYLDRDELRQTIFISRADVPKLKATAQRGPKRLGSQMVAG